MLESYTASEALEIQQYLCEWEAGTYDNVAQSVLDHAERKGFSPLRYLRKALIVKEQLEFLDQGIVRMIRQSIERGVSF